MLSPHEGRDPEVARERQLGRALVQHEAVLRERGRDALQMPFCDRAFDGVVMFRFLHHLPAGASDRAIAEACRVARRFVVVSFFHPCSLHHAQRLLRRLGGTADTRFTRRLGNVRAAFARAGFRLVAHAAQLPFARDLWLASFERTAPVAGADRA